MNSAACTAALEALARKAADDLTILANTGKPEYRPLARDASKMPFASLRASGAAALGHLSPGPEDTPLLAGLVNDPVPAVRRSARRALESSSDPAARPLAQRAQGHESDGLRPQAVPTADQLRTPLYAGAQYLFYASNKTNGQSEFSTGDPVDKVAAFYAGKYGAGMTLEQFQAAAKGGKDAMPDIGSQAFQDQMQAAMDAQKAYEAAIKAGKSQQDASMAMVAAMQKKAPADSSRIRSTLERKEIYGSPRLFVVEKGMMPGAPNRLVAVLQGSPPRQDRHRGLHGAAPGGLAAGSRRRGPSGGLERGARVRGGGGAARFLVLRPRELLLERGANAARALERLLRGGEARPRGLSISLQSGRVLRRLFLLPLFRGTPPSQIFLRRNLGSRVCCAFCGSGTGVAVRLAFPSPPPRSPSDAISSKPGAGTSAVSRPASGPPSAPAYAAIASSVAEMRRCTSGLGLWPEDASARSAALEASFSAWRRSWRASLTSAGFFFRRAPAATSASRSLRSPSASWLTAQAAAEGFGRALTRAASSFRPDARRLFASALRAPTNSARGAAWSASSFASRSLRRPSPWDGFCQVTRRTSRPNIPGEAGHKKCRGNARRGSAPCEFPRGMWHLRTAAASSFSLSSFRWLFSPLSLPAPRTCRSTGPKSWALKYYTAVDDVHGPVGAARATAGNGRDRARGRVGPVPSPRATGAWASRGPRSRTSTRRRSSPVRASSFGLPAGFAVEAGWVPPIGLNGGRANLFDAALEKTFVDTASGSFGLRLYGQFGHAYGDFTCPEDVVSQPPGSPGNPQGCNQRSEDAANLNDVGAALAGGVKLGTTTLHFAGGATYNDLQFQVGAYTNGDADNTLLTTHGWTSWIAAGAEFRVAERFSIAGEAFYSPLRVKRPPATESENDGLFNVRGMLRWAFP